MRLKWGPFAEKRKAKKLYCSFCGKDSNTVKALLAGPAVFICDGCVGHCNKILAGEIPPPLESHWDKYSDELLLSLLAHSSKVADDASEFLRTSTSYASGAYRGPTSERRSAPRVKRRGNGFRDRSPRPRSYRPCSARSRRGGRALSAPGLPGRCAQCASARVGHAELLVQLPGTYIQLLGMADAGSCRLHRTSFPSAPSTAIF